MVDMSWQASDIDPIRRSTKVQFINRLKKFHRMDIFY